MAQSNLPANDLASRVAAGPLAAIQTRHLFAMKLDVRPIVTVGPTPAALRRTGQVTGGLIIGDRINGQVLDGGNDWQAVRSDGSVSLDVRLVFQTTDGALVAMTYRGLRRGPPEILQRLDRGEEVDPAHYYFRIAPMFEAADARVGWINDILAIGIGHRFPDGPVYNVFEVL